ncbi:septal ring lytic transglycosylase RlpA family protein [Flavobacterium salilacus subsp. salilacus]|uniref:septal ring lytic transglycosylase RlpA family protein n=1 Tax=Flavobacterium TaxID=237 RepID=UPI0010757491|nr:MULTISPECIES: septal ring lytic transglycosylase RlpA family protein [Flavobacterium]KAF2518310.1 septal ring lytic transglycosylase RlpA family protein [Flavobacterium salilacus subsp. salilacus]MBE1615276.1 septal ring lytic transglycosylase RlpA family protein [Flavobacterium sp. SaA2.13]
MKKSIILLAASLMLMAITGFTTVYNNRHQPGDTEEVKLKQYKQNVVATYYADKFNGRKTSSGERFDNTKYTAAHKTLPFGTMVRVTNRTNGKWVDVRVNDRGPYSKKLEIDITKKAFTTIASKNAGIIKVNLEIIENK